MTLTASRRLPGIGFEVQPPLPEDVLPRMDIAGFVGFASSGPVGVPVAIEDVSELAAIFGPDAPLAWDATRGEPVNAHLAPAVRAFFRNGGRRCHVVRIAGEDAADDEFELAGVVAARVTGTPPAVTFAPGRLRAASPGSWADGLRLETRVVASPVRLEAIDLAGRRLAAIVARGDEVVAGDLVRVRFLASRWTLLLVAESVAFAPGTSSPPAASAGRRLDVRWSAAFWQGPPDVAPSIAGVAAYLGAAGHDVSAPATAAVIDDAGAVRVVVDESATEAPRVGSTMRFTFASAVMQIVVTDIESSAAGPAVLGTATTISLAAPEPTPQPASGGLAERLELVLRVERPGGAPALLTGVGFAPAHPRFAGALLDDSQRYAPADEPAGDAAPRFPLAGPAQPPACYLPVADTLLAPRALGALRPPGDARLRDGLEHFDARLFLDPDLASTGRQRLVETADWLRDQSPNARPLHGIHALLDRDEVTIVAVPDAVHRDWSYGGAADAAPPDDAIAQEQLDWSEFRACDARIPAAPQLTLSGDPEQGAFTLTWTPTDVGGAQYELHESADPGFVPAETIFRGAGRSLEINDRPAGSILYYQVRAVSGTAVSDPSNRLAVRTAPAARWLVHAPAAHDVQGLADLHVALLRMCAARGDMIAVLALPEHYRERAASGYLPALEAASRDNGGIDHGAARDPIFGYGALYHPWLHASEPDRRSVPRSLPPDGAAAGVLAARAAARGAWIGPANEPLRDIVALEPALALGARQAMQDANVNVVRQEPEGFMWLCADTLSDDESVRSIGVRRLLQTVRRLALRHGDAMAFEPNDDVARRARAAQLPGAARSDVRAGGVRGPHAGRGISRRHAGRSRRS